MTLFLCASESATAKHRRKYIQACATLHPAQTSLVLDAGVQWRHPAVIAANNTSGGIVFDMWTYISKVKSNVIKYHLFRNENRVHHLNLSITCLFSSPIYSPFTL